MGAGIGMGNTCKPMAVSFQCMTKYTTIKKKKRKERQSIKIRKPGPLLSTYPEETLSVDNFLSVYQSSILLKLTSVLSINNLKPKFPLLL